MYRTIKAGIPRDPDYPERTWNLDVLGRVLDGTFYDHLPYAFHDEKDTSGKYVPLRSRRPSTQCGIAKTVVDDSVSLLFSEAHFPPVRCEDEKTRTAFATLIRDMRLNWVMIEAATKGSVGSIALLLRVLNGRPFVTELDTRFLTPTWDPAEPDTLLSVTERYKVAGRDLAAQGYAIPDDRLGEDWWFERAWDAQAETWYLPVPVQPRQGPAKGGKTAPVPKAARQVDKARTVRHGLGFVPIVWIKNLPGGKGVDGASTFEAAIPNIIEIDYILSQNGRGLRYSADPTLLIKEPAGVDPGGEMVKGAANAIVVDREGDAKLLEIDGTASAAVLAYVQEVRGFALEQIHGNRSSADKLAVTQSGRAMELLYQALIWLADRMRVSYGTHGLLALLCMVQRVAQTKVLKDKRGRALEIDPDAELTLAWPKWFHPTSHDLLEMAQGLQVLRQAGVLSRETGVRLVADDYDLPDAAAEIKRIEAEPQPVAPPPPGGNPDRPTPDNAG